MDILAVGISVVYLNIMLIKAAISCNFLHKLAIFQGFLIFPLCKHDKLAEKELLRVCGVKWHKTA
jgi:hypothetical protein